MTLRLFLFILFLSKWECVVVVLGSTPTIVSIVSAIK